MRTFIIKTIFLQKRENIQIGKNQITLPINNLPRGVYFVQIKNIQNGEQLVRKLVIQSK